jgi:hypothetical protein
MLPLAQNLFTDSYETQQIATLGSQVTAPIQIGSVESFVALVVFVFGVGAAWTNLKSSVQNLENTLKDEIAPDLKDMRERFALIEDRVDSLWKDKLAPARSPRVLNARGRRILKDSGIQKIVEDQRQELERVLRASNPATAYDAERQAISTVMSLPNRSPELVAKIKEGAFRVGAEVDSVLFVGGVYFRDEVFPKLGFGLLRPARRQVSNESISP